ncbi:MAG: DUF1566 domain-containing protein [Woeseiaceae bacterium]|nr:DUF1566 domain-containing protein [Woeseiaceae bacterium]
MRCYLKYATLVTLVLLFTSACDQGGGDDSGLQGPRYNLVRLENDTCIFDSLTGLLWQGKTDVTGLHDYRNTYSWWNPQEAHGELDYRGTENAGVCTGSACDTWHYVIAVNDAGYCGFNDWRLPAKGELFSISDLQKADNPPTQDTTVFTWSQAAEYWSANDYSFQWDAAWAWNFEFGHDRVDWKKTPKFVRLVRGSAERLPEVKE